MVSIKTTALVAVSLASSSLVANARTVHRHSPRSIVRVMVHSKRQGSLVNSATVDFGSCSTPQIIGATGLDGRVEFAFEPADKASFNHGSAQNIAIITRSICDTLVSTCGATTAGHDLCQQAETAVGAGKDDGALADKFNAFFGLTTNFASAAGSKAAGAVNAGANAGANANANANTGNANTNAGNANTNAGNANANTGNANANAGNAATNGQAAAQNADAGTGAASDFGSCSAPSIIGALGLDGRKEFAFEPTNKADYPHTSAQNIDIIMQFECDTLVNTCKASTAAHDLCEQARAAVGVGKNDGALADKFNAFFGETTNFAGAAGSVSGGAAAAAPVVNQAAVVQPAAAVDCGSNAGAATPAETPAPVVSAAPAVGAVSGSNVDLGSCSNPEIVFENGLDGRQDPAFIAANQQDFAHGSALNIGVITSFIIDRLGSSCKAPAATVTLAQQAAEAAAATGGKDGSAADAWNEVFGITSNFAAGATNARRLLMARGELQGRTWSSRAVRA